MITVFAVSTGLCQGSLIIPAGHSDGVEAISYAPDGDLILSASSDHQLKLWDVRSGLLVRTLYGHKDRVLAASFSPGGSKILSSCKGAMLNLWNTETGELQRSFTDIPSIVLSIAFTNEQFALLGCMNGKILSLDLASGEIWYTLDQHQAPVGTIGFLEDGAYLISGDWKGGLLLWDLSSKKVNQVFEQGPAEITSIAADQSGFFYTGDASGKLKLWNRSNKSAEHTYNIHQEAVLTVGVIPGPRYGIPVCGGKGKAIYFGTPTQTDRLFVMDKKQAHNNWILDLDISPDGRQLATCSWDGEVSIWDTSTRSLVKSVSQVAEEGLAVDLSKDERYALLGLKDGSIHFIDLSTGRQQYAFPNHLSWVTDVCLAPDLSEFASASLDKTVRIQKLGDKTPFKTFMENESSGVSALCYWPDGTKILYAVGDTLRLRATEQGNVIRNIPVPSSSPVRELCVSKDGSLTLALADSTVFLFDLDGRLVRKLSRNHLQISSACFSPDERYVLTTSWDRTARLWDILSGKIIQSFNSSEPLYALAFRDSLEFLTASENGSISQWRIGRDEPLIKFNAHDRPITGLKAGPTTVLSISEDQSLKIWKADSMREVAQYIPINHGRFFTVSPNGYYSCSKSRSLLSQGGVREDRKVYPLVLKDVQLNRPDLIAANMVHPNLFLTQSFYRAYQKRLLKFGITEQQFSPGQGTTTTISIQNEEEIPAIIDTSLTIKASVTDTVYGIRDIQIKNFGIPQWSLVFPDTGIIRHWEGYVEVNLAHGPNEVELSASNRQGIKPLPKLTYVNNSSGKRMPNLYLLTIGVSEYAQPQYNLTYAAKDAKDIATAFKSNSLYGEVNRVVLVNQNVSRETIRLALEEFKEADEDDVVVVHYSGQGIIDENYDYFLTTHRSDPTRPRQNDIPYDSIKTWIESLRPLRKLLILDACHSGEINKASIEDIKLRRFRDGEVKFRDMTFTQDTIPDTFRALLSDEFTPDLFVDLTESSLFVISSANGVEFALEGKQWENSVFTYAFLKGLIQGLADSNGNRIVTLPEIFNYIYDKIPELTGFFQRPTWRGTPPYLDFPLWKVE